RPENMPSALANPWKIHEREIAISRPVIENYFLFADHPARKVLPAVSATRGQCERRSAARGNTYAPRVIAPRVITDQCGCRITHPSPALVQQLNVVVVTWVCSRYGLGQKVAPRICHSERMTDKPEANGHE